MYKRQTVSDKDILFMKSFYVFFVFLNLFLTENILLLFGVTNFSLINNLILAVSVFLLFVSDIVMYRYRRSYCISFSILFMLQILFYLFTGADGFKSTMCIGAMFVAGAMPVNEIRNRNIWKTFFYLFLSFYILECSLAIIERVFSTNLPILRIGESLWEGVDTGENSAFRSEALLGHPLQNALIVISAMSFILVSKFSVNWKFGLWGLGFFALLCFNTRFAIVFSVLLMGVYLLKEYGSEFTNREKRKVLLYVIVGFVLSIVLIFIFGLGDRLLNMGLMDESSASVRFSLFDIFIGIDFNTLLMPMDSKRLESLMFYRDIKVVENFWVIFLFNYGFIFLGIIVVVHFFILRVMYKNYSVFPILFTAFTFFVTASTNNSLVTSWHMLAYYFFFVILFDPKMQLFILPASMKSDKLKIESKLLLYLLSKKTNEKNIRVL